MKHREQGKFEGFTICDFTPQIDVVEFQITPNTEIPQWMLNARTKLMNAGESTRFTLSQYMSNNTPYMIGDLSIGRSLSAFYYILQNGKIILEMGKITSKGDQKLHDYIKKASNYYRNPLTTNYYSGHIAPINDGQIALVERCHSAISFSYDDLLLSSTFVAHNIFPITADGEPMIQQ